MYARGSIFVLATGVCCLFIQSSSLAQSPSLVQSSLVYSDARYSWMLPKTVIDATIVYTLESCIDPGKDANGKDEHRPKIKVSIKPTLTPKAIPDTYVGRKAIKTDQLISWLSDQNITVKTFASSHILNSMGSAPANQTAQIIGNILGGIAKVVGIALGISGPAIADQAAVLKCGAAKQTADDIKTNKAKIKALQTELAQDGLSEATQKAITAEIQAVQNLITALQADVTITIKKTIDPGYSPVDINKDDSEAQLYYNQATPPAPIEVSGLIARFDLTQEQLNKAKWFAGDLLQQEKDLLQVNVYLDFPDSYLPVTPDDGDKKFHQTKVEKEFLFRDVSYIPILVWRGQKPDKPAKIEEALLATDEEPTVIGPVQLNAAQTMAFAQFGAPQALPVRANGFQNLNWSITFLENGEVTDASFASKSEGVVATGIFGTAASAASSIATEVRSASSQSSQAAALQAQADLIYQRGRLSLCESDPKNCPSK